ncbi:MAG: 50S ribosomal protein L9 [Patescibacteria group bacterium]
MKVLLLKDVPGVGQKNDVKDVNDGFARNFLFVKKLAVAATDERLQFLEREEAGKQEKQLNEKIKYQDIADKINSVELIIATKVGEKGKAFGSIGASHIKRALGKQGIDIEEEWVELEEPLKTTGSKQIPLKFPHGVFGFVTVTIKSE